MMHVLFLKPLKQMPMKAKIYTSLLLTLFIASAKAQCPFDPFVTPSNLILCPNTTDTLWTQVYDSYQWYKDGNIIPGATNQYYVVDHFLDGGSYFAVEATDSSCAEMSPQVLVDGWAFLLPFVIQEGDQGWFDGQYLHLCNGDTLILIMGLPYDVNIQWYDGLAPIPGATDDTLLVTTSGSYTVEGAPSICPNFLQQLGLYIDVLFHQPIVPVITLVNDTLWANPNANSYQWYLNSAVISGATNQWYYPTASGSYTVSVTDTNQCSAISAPFVVTDVEEIFAIGKIRITYNGSFISVHTRGCPEDELRLYDATGRLKQKFSGKPSYEINSQLYEDGIYLLTLQCGKERFRQKIILQK